MANRAHQALRVLVYTNFNTTTLVDDLTQRWTDLKFSSALHGGFRNCQLSAPMGLDKAALWLEHGALGRHFYHLEISEEKRIVWEGRIMNIELDKSPSFQGIHVEAFGYWSSARDRYYSSGSTAWADSGTLIRDIVTQACPDLNGTAEIGITGLDITGFNGSSRDYPQNWIIDKIAPLSTPSNDIYYFGVWANRVPYFTARSTAQVDWDVSMSNIDFLHLRQQAEHLRNSVQPVIGTADGTSSIDAESTVRYGVRREIILSLQAGVPSTAANEARDSMLSERRFPRQDLSFSINGHIYSRRATAGSGTANVAVETQKWWLRAGEVIRIHDLYPASQATARLDDVRTFYILEASYDAVRDIVSIQPDRPAKNLQNILAQMGTLERTR